MTTWKAFWACVACLLMALVIGAQYNIVFHAAGILLAILAFIFFVKFTRSWKRDLTGRRGSQAMLAARREQPPVVVKTTPGSNSLSFKSRSNEIMDA